jgi:hypothetical protein
MPLNLSPMQRFIEKEMIDTLLIQKDPEGFRDDLFNEETGQYDSPTLEDSYTGPGLIVPITSSPNEEPEGGGDANYTRFTGMIPVAAPKPEPYMIVTMVNCVRDPQSNGVVFEIESVETNSFPAMTSFLLTKRVMSANR